MAPPLQLEISARSGSARAGVLSTPHGVVLTPAFMPVATQGSVKSLTPEEVESLGAGIILANAYHLYLQPGVDLIRDLGGIHNFTGWNGPMLTDSGGFQAFSLGFLKKISEEGIQFRSHIDGSEHFFSPESAILYEHALGADIIMCLDQCIANGESCEAVRSAMERTHRWAARCMEVHRDGQTSDIQALFGIVQGGIFHDMRDESANRIMSIGFDGYAVGGLAVGEGKSPMYDVTEQMGRLLPDDRPRYLMGVGSPEDLLECVDRGMDLFDCALPTRVARNGGLFTSKGRVDIKNRRYSKSPGPLEESCDCYTCRRFSVAFLHHLYKAKELLGLRLGTMHNLRFVLRLMEEMRSAIVAGTFEKLKESFLGCYQLTDQSARLAQKEAWMEERKIREPNTI